MWYIVVIVWLVMMYPLARDVDKQMQDIPNKYNILINLIIFLKMVITMPIFYILVIKNLFTKNK
jgi:cell division protein FtsI/penicillin-binding protein 2